MSDGRMLFERERQDMARIVRVIFERKTQMSQEGIFPLKPLMIKGKTTSS